MEITQTYSLNMTIIVCSVHYDVCTKRVVKSILAIIMTLKKSENQFNKGWGKATRAPAHTNKLYTNGYRGSSNSCYLVPFSSL